VNHKVTVIALRGVNAYLVEVAGPSVPAAGGGRLGDAEGFGHADGLGFVLVDTGFSFRWSQLRQALLDRGCLPGLLRLIVITHGDMDHTGNVPKLRREYDAPVAIHPADVERMRSGRMPKRTSPSRRGRIALWVAAILGRVLPSSRAGAASFAPDVLLEDGMRLDEYGLAAQVIHTPGHSPGSVAILTDDGSLFSGDTVFASRKALLLMENPDEFKRSVGKLRELASAVRTVYPGHGKPFPGAELGQPVAVD
jgi:hydroxyacylglutathione hydrolase